MSSTARARDAICSRWAGSVPAVAGGGRQRAAPQRAIRGGRRFALGDIIGIGDAIEKPSRGGRLALLVTREGAVAQPRILVSLKAERISGADRFGRRGAEGGQSACGKHGQNSFPHFASPHRTSELRGFHFIDTSRTGALASSGSALVIPPQN